jgi:hypothetical protein
MSSDPFSVGYISFWLLVLLTLINHDIVILDFHAMLTSEKKKSNAIGKRQMDPSLLEVDWNALEYGSLTNVLMFKIQRTQLFMNPI